MKRLIYSKKPTIVKNLSIEEFIEYRNYLIQRGTARTKNFGDNNKNYYWYTLSSLEKQYPEFNKSLGIIKLKEL